MVAELVYCRHKFTAEGVIPVKPNVQAILEVQRSQNTSQLNLYNKLLP